MKPTLKLLILIFLISISLSVFAQDSFNVIYPQYYRFNPGDNIEWSNPDIDDSNWKEYNLKEFPEDQWQGFGWVRITVKTDSSLIGIPLGMKLYMVGAVEIYIDGIAVHQYGTVASNLNDEEGIFVFEHPEITAFSFLPTQPDEYGISSHVIALRISSFIVYEGILKGLPPSFDFKIGSLAEYRNEVKKISRNASIHQMFFLGVLLAFSIIHFLLFLYYKKFKPNLYFAVLTLLVALLAFFRFERIFIDDVYAAIWNFRIFNFIGILTLLAYLRFTYYLVYENLPKSFLFISTIGVFVFIWFFISPIAAFDILTILFLIIIVEMLRVIIVSLVKKRTLLYDDSWIILIGILPFTVTSIYKALSRLMLVPELWDFISFPYTYYSLLILLLSMSVFLARNFAKINKDLEIQLEQVKSLSEKTLQQEIEKTKLKTENERKTQELEEARKLQLSMLPKEIPQSSNFEVTVYMQTATEVGGDYYDFYVDDDDTLTIAVGDATGHGMQAGTMVAASKSLFKAKAVNPDPSLILKESSNALKEMGFSLMFMAMTLAKLSKDRIILSSAGMPFTLLYRAEHNKVEELEVSGMPMGSMKDFPYKTEKINIKSGDVILFMSDGFPELFNTKNDMLGYDKAVELFCEAASKKSGEVIEQLIYRAKNWAGNCPLKDDITFVVVKIK
jgi:serine phosphatase RsbU (regulator of sigma subunit)